MRTTRTPDEVSLVAVRAAWRHALPRITHIGIICVSRGTCVDDAERPCSEAALSIQTLSDIPVRSLSWTPSECDASLLPAIAARASATAAQNVCSPLLLDAAGGWSHWSAAGVESGAYDAVLAVNLTHISPWASTEGLLRGAARALKPGGRLCIYGPFRRNGTFNGAGDEAFDATKKARGKK